MFHKGTWTILTCLITLLTLTPGEIPRASTLPVIVNPPPSKAPVARIKKIKQASSLAKVNATVLRDGKPVVATLQTELFTEDVIATGANTSIVIVSLDPDRSRDDRCLIGPNSRLIIKGADSIFIRFGKMLSMGKSYFKVQVKHAYLAPEGTEFEVTVSSTDESTRLVVLEGAINVGIENNGPSKIKALGAITIGERVVRGKASVVSKKVGGVREQVQSALDWTNDVILAGQPTYSTERIIPHVASSEERVTAFRGARRDAILGRSKEQAAGYETLGNIYADWEDGAEAIRAYGNASKVNRSKAKQGPPVLLTNLAEAYRIDGQLEAADKTIREVLALSGRYAPALNALGNIQLDRARIALDKGDFGQAKTLAEEARINYENSYQVAGIAPDKREPMLAGMLLEEARSNYKSSYQAASGQSAVVRAVAQANTGESHLVVAEIARREGRLPDARREYLAATQAFDSSKKLYSKYPYSVTGMGQALHGQGIIARSTRQTRQADQFLGQAETQFKEALDQHKDMVAAYVGLGDVNRDQGREQDAMANYTLAIQFHPDNPAPYYSLAVLLERTNPEQAANYFRSYLRMERESFRQGEKVKHAQESVTGIKTPDVLKMTLEAAREAIVRSGLTVGRTRDEETDQYPEGTIIRQDPAPGQMVSPGTPLNVFVARRSRVSTPDVSKMTLEAAREAIVRSGLTVGRTRDEETDQYPEGTIIRQDPAPGQMVSPGTPLNVFVARRSRVSTPDVSKMTLEAAREAIVRSGLTVGRTRDEETDQYEEGTIISQDPSPGQTVLQGATINLVVARRSRVRTPNVLNMTLEAAQKEIARSGLTVGQTTAQETDEYKLGTIISQDPAPGQTVPPGTLVNVFVARNQSGMVVIPDVINKREFDAIRMIQEAGLIPQVVERRGAERAQKDRKVEYYVTSQDPPGGRGAKQKSEVRLWLQAR